MCSLASRMWRARMYAFGIGIRGSSSPVTTSVGAWMRDRTGRLDQPPSAIVCSM
jgi:hypothetical protein